MKPFACISLLVPALLASAPGLAQEEKPAKDMITQETREVIDAGLGYLAKQQAEDGSRGMRNYPKNVGITSLAGLAFLSAGRRPGQVPHGEVLARAIDYILKRGEERHLRLPAGFFLQDRSPGAPMYNHGYAVLVLAEAHAVLKGDEKQEVTDALKRGVRIIVDAQNKEGGWRYLPDSRDADLSVTACQLHALLAAMKAGIEVPPSTLKKAVGYVRSCSHPKEGFFRYQPQWGGNSSGAFPLSAARAGEDELWKRGLAHLKAVQPARTGRDTSYAVHYYYGQFYAASALQHVGGKDWRAWYPVIRDALLKPPTTQTTTREKDGSWSGGGFGCRHYNTALAVLILQAPDSRLASAAK